MALNDLEVAKQKQLDLASAKSQDVVNTKEIAQAEREAIAALKERQAIEAQVNKIQLSMDTGETESKIEALIFCFGTSAPCASSDIADFS